MLEECFYVDEHPWYLFSAREEGEPEEDDDEPGADGAGASEGDEGTAGSNASEGAGGEEALGGQGASADPAHIQQLKQEWEDASRSVQTGLETVYGRQERGGSSGDLLQALQALNRRRYDYKQFLRRFTTFGEQMRVNDDEFDYIYYTYGLETYGDLPLVEPLEYKDVQKLRDIAIVLDTSGSVSGQLMQRLFECTFDLISNEENAHRRFRIHLIQCDTQVKDDLLLRSREDLEQALSSMEFKGLGGTDYIAAFEYVDELIARGEFVNFKGLLYFTDGNGKFPARMPAYKTAFVFVEEDYHDVDVPPWAIKLILTADEVRKLRQNLQSS